MWKSNFALYALGLALAGFAAVFAVAIIGPSVEHTLALFPR